MRRHKPWLHLPPSKVIVVGAVDNILSASGEVCDEEAADFTKYYGMLPLFENVVQVVVSLDLSNGAHAVEEIDIRLYHNEETLTIHTPHTYCYIDRNHAQSICALSF